MTGTNERTVVGVDIGGGHVSCAAVRLADLAVVPGSERSEAVDSKARRDEILQRWAAAIGFSLGRVDRSTVAGIAFAMPGPFDYRRGVALFEGCDKFEALHGIDVRAALTERLPAAFEMRFINDATAFGIGAACRETRHPTGRAIAVTLGTGFGSAFMDSGRPVTSGADVPLHGSLWHLPFQDAIVDDFLSTRWFRRRFAEMTGREVPGVREIAELARTEPRCRSLFTEYGRNLAAVLVDWLRPFSPDVLVIGGNVTGAFDLFSGSFNESLAQSGVSVRTEIVEDTDTLALTGATRLFEADYWAAIRADLPAR